MKDLVKLAVQCQKDLASLGIGCGHVRNWSVNTRATARWGQCRQIATDVYDISISRMLLQDEVADQKIRDTIIHELLHTVPGCMNHTGKWRELAQMVNRELPGYTVERVTKPPEKGLPEPEKPYLVQCTKCGQSIQRSRKSCLILHPENYRCGVCGGHLQRVK